ncbi:MAG TPA: HNH endonuclease signature motif containing protein [Methanofastidiosum sp.]|nr:HNH endonuclease signature motif containing protein [Methanofastidiosum sp.]
MNRINYKNKFLDYSNNSKKCNFCKRDIPYNKRLNSFCNHSCAASFHNKGKKRHGEHPGNCLNCNKKLEESKRKYCCRKCQHDFEWKEFCKIIEKENKFKSYTTNAIPKKYLIEKRGHKCEICGITEWQGKPVPLVLDHIDGNSDNWNIFNCRLICRNCDGFLPTFSGRNTGKGRFTLRMKGKKERSLKNKAR